MPGPTSRSPSPTSGRRRTRPSGGAGCACRPSGPELLDAQLEALAVAAKDTGADVRVMAPMVATVEEAAWFARRVRENGLPKAGVMIEVPGAALRAEHVLAEVDFGSLGTNDLAQYTMAADRMQGELSDLLDPWQPAVLDVVAAACDGARRVGRPIGVCGESAGDPLLALVLAGLGVVEPVDGAEQGAGRAAGAVAALAARVPGAGHRGARGPHGQGGARGRPLPGPRGAHRPALTPAASARRVREVVLRHHRLAHPSCRGRWLRRRGAARRRRCRPAG